MSQNGPEFRSASLNAQQNANGKTQLMFNPGILDSVTMGFNQALSSFVEWLNGNFASVLRYGILLGVLGLIIGLVWTIQR